MDEAIRNLSAAIQRGDFEQIEMYRAAFSERIDELEEFYLHHDDGGLRSRVAGWGRGLRVGMWKLACT